MRARHTGSFVLHLVFSLLLFTAEGLSQNAYAENVYNSASEYYEDARKRSAEGDSDGAIIQLKNSLQNDPEHIPSLLLLGKLEFNKGNEANAARLLSDALLIGADPTVATPLLARALVDSGQYSELLRTIPASAASSDSGQAEIYALRARAFTGLGKLREATTEVGRAIDKDPQNFEALLVSSILALRQGANIKALEYATSAAGLRPQSGRAAATLGDARQASGDITAAIDAYERALRLLPEHIDARIAVVAIYFRMGDDEAAVPHVEFLRKEAVNEPRAVYFSGLAAARKGNGLVEKDALSRAATLTGTIPSELLNGNPQLLMTGALSQFGLGNFSSSANYLERYLGISADDPGANRLLAANLLALGKHQHAKQRLAKLNRQYPNDDDVRSMLASALALGGDYVEAARLLATVQGVSNGQHSLSTQYAIALINSGQRSAGLNTLEAVLEEQPELVSLRYSLAVGYLQADRPDLARAQIDLLAEDAKNDRQRQNLLAIAEKRMGNIEGATDIWLAMLEANQSDMTARINLAQMARQAGNFDDAQELLFPENIEITDNQGLYALEKARLALATGEITEALRFAEKAATDNPLSYEAAALQAQALIGLGKLSEAESITRKFAAKEAAGLAGGLLYADTLAKLEQPKQALLVLTQLSRRADFDISGLTKIAARQSQLGAYDSALHSLEMVIKSDKSYGLARFDYLRNLLLANRLDTAITAAIEYDLDYPDDPMGQLTIAEAQLNLGNFKEATQAYEHAGELGAQIERALGIYRSQRKQSELTSAERTLLDALEQAPNDLRLMAALSDILVTEARWEEADIMLSRILEARPDSVAHLNNRALARLNLGMPGATDDARKAQKLAPADANVNDTLGWLLVKSGEKIEGLAYLREAAARDTRDPAIKFHTAVALHDLGRREEALNELYAALASDQPFVERDIAKKLQEEIQ